MKLYKLFVLGLAVSGLFATQSIAQPGLFAGMAKIKAAPVADKAQFKLPFGMSAGKAREILSRDGFDEIEVTHVGLIDARAEACRKGTRYKIQVRTDGSYGYRDEIGKCRPIIRADAVDDIVRRQGYEQIDLNDDAVAPYDITACRSGDRYELEVDQYGDVKVKGKRGRCASDMLSPRDVRRALRKDGFDRIKFVDRTPPRYVVEACRNGNHIRLNINRNGKKGQPERIGRCDREIKSSDIPRVLEKAGYTRVDIVDGKPPRYIAEACNRANKRIRIAISPWGDRIRERAIGECAPPATVASLSEQLRASKNITLISVREGGRGNFIADVCSTNSDRHEIRFSQWGQFMDTKRTGKCVSPKIEELLSRYERGGFKNAQTFIVGCTRDGERLRLSIDQFGNEIEREQVGRCR